MKILYIDESGDTASFEQGGHNTLILTGCIIDENAKHAIEARFRKIKKKYYWNEDIEIKSNFLRYANPRISDLAKTSPIKLYDQARYDDLQADIQKFLKEIPTTVIAIVMNKRGYWAKYPAQNPYHAASCFRPSPNLKKYIGSNPCFLLTRRIFVTLISIS